MLWKITPRDCCYHTEVNLTLQVLYLAGFFALKGRLVIKKGMIVLWKYFLFQNKGVMIKIQVLPRYAVI